MPYFKKIISSVKKNDVKFEFSDYRGENKLRIESFIQAEGISSDNYTIVELDSLLINSDCIEVSFCQSCNKKEEPFNV
jgi:hypothetical protein